MCLSQQDSVLESERVGSNKKMHVLECCSLRVLEVVAVDYREPKPKKKKRF